MINDHLCIQKGKQNTGMAGAVVQYWTRNQDAVGTTLTWFIASNSTYSVLKPTELPTAERYLKRA